MLPELKNENSTVRSVNSPEHNKNKNYLGGWGGGEEEERSLEQQNTGKKKKKAAREEGATFALLPPPQASLGDQGCLGQTAAAMLFQGRFLFGSQTSFHIGKAAEKKRLLKNKEGQSVYQSQTSSRLCHSTVSSSSWTVAPFQSSSEEVAAGMTKGCP